MVTNVCEGMRSEESLQRKHEEKREGDMKSHDEVTGSSKRDRGGEKI